MPANAPSPVVTPVHADPELNRLHRAVRKAQHAFRSSQLPDGHWDSEGNSGPAATAWSVVALAHMGRLTPADAADFSRWLRAQQRADGSFELHPYARTGDVGATAYGWAALHVCKLPENEAAIARAKAYVERNGGLDKVLAGMDTGDLSAVFMALAGLLDPQRLPCPPAAWALVPPLVKLSETRFHAGILMVALQLNVLVRSLRGDFGRDGSRGLLARAEADAMVKLLETFQNRDGGWNSYSLQTSLALPALRAAGLRDSDPRITRGLAWLEAQKIRDAHGLHYVSFGTGVWSTAFDIRAQLAAGAAPGHAPLKAAIAWLVESQCTAPQPLPNNRQEGAIRTGGWAFERGNDTMADSDDTAVVLSALGQALNHARAGGLEPELDRRVRASVDKGRDWLLGMQNPDGGWSSFVWNLPPKQPGPAMSRPAKAKLDDPLSMLPLVFDPEPGLGDPSTEDVTARVLHALGQLGFRSHSPEVRKAVEFLQKQQCTHGGWWGRWVVNDLAATSFVFLGLRAVGWDMREPFVARARDWVLAHQNPDGGWGETPATYRDPSKAGQGPSMAPLTGLVIQGLIDAGEGGSEAVARGVRFLLERQRPDGTWPNDDYLHCIAPPDTYYSLLEAARYYPTEALGRYLSYRGEGPAPAPERWTNAQLDAARGRADPLADKVISAIYAKGDLALVNEVLGKMFRSDDPIPAGMPPEVVAYFEANPALPAWTDPAKVKVAQQLFTRAGWEVATALFCSSLPQAYAAAKGAAVLTQTGAMTRHVRQRIFETAQFVFDVLDEGSLAPGGRGVRTTQKVRLMHAGIRHLLLMRKEPAWDAKYLGLPINQEDMAGTLLTFSIVSLEGVQRLGVKVSPEEADAWVHTWNAVGTVLGVEPELQARDRADANLLMDAIRERQWAPSADGRKLTSALVELLEEFVTVPLLKGAPSALVRDLVGEHCADLIGLPPADWTRLLIEFAEIADPLVADGARELGISRLYDGVRQAIMHGVARFEREGKAVRFRIPTSLRNSLDNPQPR